MAEFLDTFLKEHLPTTASESFLVSLNKFVLLHRRCLMSKFSEILKPVCRKIFFDFNFAWNIFPIAVVYLLCKNLIFYILTYYLMIGNIFLDLDLFEQLSTQQVTNFVSLKVPFAQLLSEKCSYKTLSENAEIIKILKNNILQSKQRIKTCNLYFIIITINAFWFWLFLLVCYDLFLTFFKKQKIID